MISHKNGRANFSSDEQPIGGSSGKSHLVHTTGHSVGGTTLGGPNPYDDKYSLWTIIPATFCCVVLIAAMLWFVGYSAYRVPGVLLVIASGYLLYRFIRWLHKSLNASP